VSVEVAVLRPTEHVPEAIVTPEEPHPPTPATSTGRSNRTVAVIVMVVVLVLAAAFIGYVVWSVQRTTEGSDAAWVHAPRGLPDDRT
jgi:uncharacterized protein HemX